MENVQQLRNIIHNKSLNKFVLLKCRSTQHLNSTHYLQLILIVTHSVVKNLYYNIVITVSIN